MFVCLTCVKSVHACVAIHIFLNEIFIYRLHNTSYACVFSVCGQICECLCGYSHSFEHFHNLLPLHIFSLSQQQKKFKHFFTFTRLKMINCFCPIFPLQIQKRN